MSWFGGKSTQQKQVESLFGITFSLYGRTAKADGDAPLVLACERSDSAYRYLIFCLSTAHVACASLMRNPDAVLNECLHGLVIFAATDNATKFFGGPVDLQEAGNEGAAHLQDFLRRWSAYVDVADGGNQVAATGIVCSMLRDSESISAATSDDARRLWPLALWIEAKLPDMRGAFSA